MGILRDFERRLEGVVEGLFARAFRSGVQPVELGKRLVREVEDGRTVGVNRVYVPNVYAYELSPGDRERFADYEVALAQELAALAVDTARERDWAMLGPARIEFETADDLEVGRFRLGSRVEADEQERDYAAAGPVARPVGPHTAMLPGQRPRPKPGAPASLILVQGGQPIRTWPLGSAEISIGRAEQSDIPLSDPGVSRNHARVVREGDDFIVEDLRSTNGTEVNGQPIRRRRLANGDMLKLASSTLQFRREG
jgi:FHA domain-containing protein